MSRISGLSSSGREEEEVTRDSLPKMNPLEHERFKKLLNQTSEILDTLLVHMTNVQQGFVEEDDVPAREALRALHGSLTMLKHYRLNSKETGFAAGEVNFLDIIGDMQDSNVKFSLLKYQKQIKWMKNKIFGNLMPQSL